MIRKMTCTILCLMMALSLCVPVQAAKNKKKTVSVAISAVGDCTLGVDSRYNSIFNNYYNAHGNAYFLQKVRPVFAEDDLTIANFEGTLTDSTQRANKTFTFKGPANYVNILKSGSVEVVNLANNHTLDFGEAGYSDTKKTLSDHGIAYCGKNKISYHRVNGVKIAFLGFHALSGRTSEDEVRAYIQKAKSKGATIIIASFHWGIERSYDPTSTQEALGRYAIDQGASLVLGHHPHVLQGIEKYKGRYIVYSLGNFCFGGNSNPSDKDTMIFRQRFYVKNGKLLQENKAKVIPCSLSSSSSHNDFQPMLLSGTAKSNLLQKIRKMSSGRNVSLSKTGMLN